MEQKLSEEHGCPDTLSTNEEFDSFENLNKQKGCGCRTIILIALIFILICSVFVLMFLKGRWDFESLSNGNHSMVLKSVMINDHFLSAYLSDDASLKYISNELAKKDQSVYLSTGIRYSGWYSFSMYSFSIICYQIARDGKNIVFVYEDEIGFRTYHNVPIRDDAPPMLKNMVEFLVNYKTSRGIWRNGVVE